MATHRSQVMISLVALVLPCLNHINTTCQHLIILKEPSAGSTWFTEELNGITGVHLIPQLFTSRDIGNLTSAKAWKRMMDLADSPCHAGTVVTGFTQNPTHRVLTTMPNFTWMPLKGLKDVHLATWTRSNFVRRAFSILNYDSCRSHNVRSEAVQAECAKPYSVQKWKLLETMKDAACNNSYIRAMAGDFAYPKSAHHMTYEEFETDKDAVLLSLMRYLQLPPDAAPVHSRKRSSLLKRSPSNISSTILNAEDVNEWLQEWSHAIKGAHLPLVDMFQSDALDLFSVHSVQSACEYMRQLIQ
eukprot:CAMPEP_0181171982 /NCGR_PEP_ID=MMETSP1096-20121128/2208_1 /TAXON_ID=156174 ORGANISM="Chrysochromulina ericina, Strain CCMP281" /NCGR_SAMPLE_ID=MMETSP1096 /ASSEMBLY_ACC=CAM_ASM_000453 /LENGTH=300 /DNA_ID=CAMNT_0023259683 /DNA_START=103 /DNA_END=1005 /DNA_ORIENTATION=+